MKELRALSDGIGAALIVVALMGLAMNTESTLMFLVFIVLAFLSVVVGRILFKEEE
jgi:membrane protein implicated in regulation of membrane protease activity